MTQDVLAHGSGGAHLHDPGGSVIGEVAPVSAPPVPTGDMGSGVPAASAARPEIGWAVAPVLTEALRAERVTAGLPPDPTLLRPDPDATVAIGRHRADGTLSGPDDWWDEPVAPPRRRFIGRVAAAVVARLRRAA